MRRSLLFFGVIVLSWCTTLPANAQLHSPDGANILVLLQDTVYGTAAQILRKVEDNNSLRNFSQRYLTDYVLMVRDTNRTTVPPLSVYRTIILIETSFITPTFLNPVWRDSLKAFLNSGTGGNQKSLIMIGADLGYNYSRSGSAVRDTILSHQMMKFVYLADNSGGSPNHTGMVGLMVNAGIQDTLLSGIGSYWPDGCRPQGGVALYRYKNRSSTDSLAAIGYDGPTYNTAAIFQDARYLLGGGVDSIGFGRVLKGVLTYIGSAGGYVTSVEDIPGSIPSEFHIAQNYPNPFNPSTTIEFSIPRSSYVALRIYDVLGREIAALVNSTLDPGTYRTTWDATGVPSGLYFYRFETSLYTATKRLVLLK